MRFLVILSLVGVAVAQPVVPGRDPRWQTIGSGVLASRPSCPTPAVPVRSVYICLGTGCTSGQAIHYCTASGWSVQGGGGGGSVSSIGLTGTPNQITVTGASPITSSGSWTLSIPTNPTLPGTTTGTFSGNLTGNVTGNVSGSAQTFTGNLTGDVTSIGMATTVGKVNGASLPTSQFLVGTNSTGQLIQSPAPDNTNTVNLYIATDGNDSNPCTSGAKCLTLAHALTLIPFTIPQKYGINAADGTYAEGICFLGYSGQGVTIIGNTSTPANVVFSQPCSYTGSDGNTITVDALVFGGNLTLSGLTLSGTATRGVLAMYHAQVALSNVNITGTTTTGIEASLNGTVEYYNTVGVSGFSTYGIYGNLGGTHSVYTGTLTITGSGSSGTSVGARMTEKSMWSMHGATGNNPCFAISAVQYGVFLTNNSTFVNVNSNCANSITNATTSTAVAGVYAGTLSSWLSNPGSITVNHFGTCWSADGNAFIATKSASDSNCTATAASQQAQIILF